MTPGFLAQVGRDLIRNGDSMHVIRIDRAGMVQLIPASSWHWEGNHDPDSWTVRVTAYGPSTSTTWNLPASGVVFVRWGGTPGQPYVGTGPLTWAHTTARLQSETERSLADEAQGPARSIARRFRKTGATMTATIRSPSFQGVTSAPHVGKALLVVNDLRLVGAKEGPPTPQRDCSRRHAWGRIRLRQCRDIAQQAFEKRVVERAARSHFQLFTDADGTSQRERIVVAVPDRTHLGTVLPLARLLEHELTAKLETPVELKFDSYALGHGGCRATVVAKLAHSGRSDGDRA